MTPIEASMEASLATRWLGRPLVVLDECGSTSDEVKIAARAGGQHGLVVVAHRQTRGRGRHGHPWHSPPGSIYLSALLRLPLAPDALPPLTLAAGVAVCETLTQHGAAASLKWPNDVLVANKKVAGVLTEAMTRGKHVEAIIVGVGLNVNNRDFPDEIAGLATSLHLQKLAAHDIEIVPLITGLLVEIEAWVERFGQQGAASIVAAFKERTHIIGKKLKTHDAGQSVVGTAIDIDDTGALILAEDSGQTRRILSGEVVLV